MPYQIPVTSPNIEKLFHYLQKSQWHNVSANFSGFVRKEFETHLDKLEEEEELYRNLKLMIEYSEMGRFSEAKNLTDTAHKEFQLLLNKLTELNQIKHTSRRAHQKPIENQDNYTRRETYTPDKREIASPSKRNTNQRQHTPHGNPGYETPKRQLEIIERHPRTPQSQHEHQQSYDPHRENYDSLRLKTPEKQLNSYMQEQQHKYDSPSRNMTPADHGSRPNSYHHGSRSPQAPGVLTSAGQMTSSKALWGRDHGDRPSEKVGSSTYRHDFPTYAVDIHERKDKEKYRENFGSLAERDMYRGSEEGSYQDEPRRGGPQSRHSETPDYDNRPSELARKFKELYSHEWTDAYDEICKDFGSEKTVRHLLWIVTEASLIASDVADHQLRVLEKQAFGVMTSPGDDNHGGYAPRHLGETLPASRSLLMKYRKQTAILSIPFVKEECREKISKTLVESTGILRSYLGDASRLTAYIYKCAELTWLMCVQDPPIVLEYITKETEGARFNHEHYHVYTKTGNTYDFGVWPMLRLGRKGEILSKGIAQGI
ncbi:uncharacterized protein LOC123557131 isoform X2 [Mercenaria mercenaria]|uniref:uncharacterized protein LOC123557131 isoform X2 n=1 Tax=Mercenaria mercenaria TaxID=6596 RepID=UPI00234EFC6C|nr:uncharacterized protein LOC123557131 isoform X2 [Mercenaria mercenaria]